MVKNKISGTWDAGKWEVVKWLRRETLGRLGLVSVKGKEGTSTGIEKEREDAKELLGNWLKDVPGERSLTTFVSFSSGFTDIN